MRAIIPLAPPRSLQTLALALLVLAPLGCGRSTGTVTGTVSLEGKPLPAGQISFVPASGPAVSAPINKDGTYTASGVPTGEVKVTVETDTIKKKIDAMKKSTAPSSSNPSLKGFSDKKLSEMPPEAKKFFEKQKENATEAIRTYKELAASYRAIPQRYMEAANSGLSLTVTSGSNTYDVPLKAK